jgi:hypothetical protein
MTPEEFKAKRDAILADPVNYIHFHRGQRRFLDLVKNPKPESGTIVEFLKGNGVGGTKAVMAAWSAIMYGTRNKDFQGSPFHPQWPFKKSARLLSTKEALKDKGPVQEALRSVFPARRYTQGRGSGTAYFSEGSTDTGWEWDVLTYDQSVLQAAGANKGLIIFVEPPPRDLFYESWTRLRGNGMVLVDMTQLDMAQFNEDLITAGALILDGRRVGEVRVAYSDVEDACREHSDGHRAHSAIEADVAGWPPEEREARRTGKPLRLSGRIYATWSDANELVELPAYHQEKWDAGLVKISSVIDPHDRKPWACAWFATFPNNDVVTIAEWPTIDFHAAKSSPLTQIEEYRAMILETEAAIGYPIWRRLMDPNFGAAPKSGSGESVMDMLRQPCRACLAYGRDEAFANCKHRLVYIGAPNEIREGHMLVRAAIGDQAKNIRPKFYTMRDSCPNMNYGMRRYAYREEKNPLKALSENPQYVIKDFPDLPRYGYNAKFDKWPATREALELVNPKFQSHATREAELRKIQRPR